MWREKLLKQSGHSFPQRIFLKLTFDILLSHNDSEVTGDYSKMDDASDLRRVSHKMAPRFLASMWSADCVVSLKAVLFLGFGDFQLLSCLFVHAFSLDIQVTSPVGHFVDIGRTRNRKKKAGPIPLRCTTDKLLENTRKNESD